MHSTIHQHVQMFIQEAIDAAYHATIQELVPTGWKIHGVRVPQLRTLAAELYKQNKSMRAEEVSALLDEAFVAKEREPVLVYLFWLAQLKRQLTPQLWPHIEQWVDQLADWEVCDQLAMGIAAPLVSQHLSLVNDLAIWAQSPNLWRRRCAVATAAALNQKGRAHVAETLRICAPLLNDPEALVRKAVGWALREASDHDTAAVYAFFTLHKTKIARTVLNEGSKNLTEAQRTALLT